jgi:hypothetical protein
VNFLCSSLSVLVVFLGAMESYLGFLNFEAFNFEISIVNIQSHLLKNWHPLHTIDDVQSPFSCFSFCTKWSRLLSNIIDITMRDPVCQFFWVFQLFF